MAPWNDHASKITQDQKSRAKKSRTLKIVHFLGDLYLAWFDPVRDFIIAGFSGNVRRTLQDFRMLVKLSLLQDFVSAWLCPCIITFAWFSCAWKSQAHSSMNWSLFRFRYQFDRQIMPTWRSFATAKTNFSKSQHLFLSARRWAQKHETSAMWEWNT
jgi:hypothetical protein